ncbi:hypothetical protein ADN01_01915 [Levilinea saccharolytica]|uniref:Uncharacterized protein n=1 Tax=Levilinea saccharolytica TaxID=229921 RepID=A0A0P6Z0B3_9CHLR|nr:hypothetical protein ADN01_01915 [Levilinea saccharolytica]
MHSEVFEIAVISQFPQMIKTPIIFHGYLPIAHEDFLHVWVAQQLVKQSHPGQCICDNLCIAIDDAAILTLINQDRAHLIIETTTFFRVCFSPAGWVDSTLYQFLTDPFNQEQIRLV